MADRPKYQKLIPQHIRDMFNLPEDVLANLEKGGFTVSLLGRPGHSVGVDEAHEMCVNRESKEFITRPSLEEHIFPESQSEIVKPINFICLLLTLRAKS